MHIAGPRSPVDRSQEKECRHEINALFNGYRTYVLRGSSNSCGVSEDWRGWYDTYYVGNPVAKIDSGAGTGTIVDETGITRNVKGEGPFHDMSVRCLYHWSVVGETNHLNGSCVETDKDGDNVFTTFDDKVVQGNIKVLQERFPTLWWNFTRRSAAARPGSSTTRPLGRSNN